MLFALPPRWLKARASLLPLGGRVGGKGMDDNAFGPAVFEALVDARETKVGSSFMV